MLARRAIVLPQRPGLSLAWVQRLVLPLLAALLLLPLVAPTASTAPEARFRDAAGAVAFDLVGWEVNHLAPRAPRVVGSLLDGQVSVGDQEREIAQLYFATQDAEARSEIRDPAERALESTLTAVLQRQELRPILPVQPSAVVFPPVSLALGEPPKLVVVSPRDRIEVTRSLLLEGGVDEPQAVRIEAGIDDAEVVSFVTPIGGLATYPSMVPATAGPGFVLEALAHEWVHAYLFFTPLGVRYWSDYEARMINETVADMAGRELGAHVAHELGLPFDRHRPAAASPGEGFDFQAEMRATRVEAERLLERGQIEAAEAYMRQRRDFFVAHGYPIRKLNQAYFAFHGSYAESGAAGVTPIPDQLGLLRERSSSIGEFLHQAGQLRGAADLARAVQDSGG